MMIIIFYYLNIGGWSVYVHSALRPLLAYCTCPRVMVRMEKLVEWTVLENEIEVLGENLSRRHFVHHKFHLPDPGTNPGRRDGKPATNRFSYGAALIEWLTEEYYGMWRPTVS
jgi:hypothetical protein